jgi:flagella basal body P-ring formation protein FlgA
MLILIKSLFLIAFLLQSGIAQTSPETVIADSIQAYFAKRTQIAPGKLRFSHFSIPALPDLKGFQYTIRVSSQRSVLKPGFQSVWVTIYRESRPVHKMAVSLSLGVYQPVCVAKCKIERQARLDAGMFTVEERLIEKTRDRFITEQEADEGWEAQRVINTGEIISFQMLRRPPLVRRGQIVRLQVRSGHIMLNSEGVAKKDGARGDRIPVEHAGTGKRIIAVVESEGLVVVDKETSL